MKKQTFFRSFMMGSLLFSWAAFATVNTEEAILGKWEYARAFCEQSTKVLHTVDQEVQGMVVTFDEAGMGQTQVSTSIMMPTQEGHNLSCTIITESATNYSIDGDMLSISSDAQLLSMSAPDCPQLQDVIDSNPQKIDAISNTTNFTITTDGTHLQMFEDGRDTACGENDKVIVEYKKL